MALPEYVGDLGTYVLRRGDDWSVTLAAEDSAGNPLDLSTIADTWSSMARQQGSPDGQPATTVTVDVSTPGQMTLSLASADVRALGDSGSQFEGDIKGYGGLFPERTYFVFRLAIGKDDTHDG